MEVLKTDLDCGRRLPLGTMCHVVLFRPEKPQTKVMSFYIEVWGGLYEIHFATLVA